MTSNTWTVCLPKILILAATRAMPGSVKRVWDVLAAFGEPAGDARLKARLKFKTIMEHTGLSYRQVRYDIEWLVSAAWISRMRGSRGSSYLLALTAPDENTAKPVEIKSANEWQPIASHERQSIATQGGSEWQPIASREWQPVATLLREENTLEENTIENVVRITPPTPPARAGRVYFFSGAVIRLTEDDYCAWHKRFPRLDLYKWLNKLDHEFREKPVKNWFMTASYRLEAIHAAIAKRPRRHPEAGTYGISL